MKARCFPSRLAVFALPLAVLAVLIFSPAPALADCCNSNSSGKCADGSCGTPCCGNGGCNIFCCNCDGGCRTGPCGGNCGVGSTTPAQFFDSVDLDKSSAISPGEFEAWAGRAGRHFETNEDRQKAFAKADSNKNGTIDPGEVDKSLVNYRRKTD